MSQKVIFDGFMRELLNNKEYRPNALDIEALCTLLEQCSTNLRKKEEEKKLAELYLKKMQDFAKHMEPRIRFRVEEICDIKNNHWLNQRKHEKAKTLKEIHEDFYHQQDQTARSFPQNSRGGHFSGNNKKNLYNANPNDLKRSRAGDIDDARVSGGIPTSAGGQFHPRSYYFANVVCSLFPILFKFFFFFATATKSRTSSRYERGGASPPPEARSANTNKSTRDRPPTGKQKAGGGNAKTRISRSQSEPSTMDVEEKKTESNEPVAIKKAIVLNSEEEVIQAFDDCLEACCKADNLDGVKQFVSDNLSQLTSHVWAEVAVKTCQIWKFKDIRAAFEPLIGHAVSQGWLTHEIAVEMVQELGSRFESERADVPMLQQIYGTVFSAIVINAKTNDFVDIFKVFVIAAQEADTTPKNWMPLLKFGLENLIANDKEKHLLIPFKSLGFASLIDSRFLKVIRVFIPLFFMDKKKWLLLYFFLFLIIVFFFE
ncbi:eukaryotic translation initiation factor 4 gamma [Reticulomyxa filosa]|uniref:Eukaryotic translation initiation factor 4 gamma n=1 Tax=Reticulomyxa filosa TaxID=46433 RepID=X6MXR3_RETFI|nr:eukaryotic translation initiation factor 4 gamma [Reticulomyxa filosa]|eukprot:ETO18626.1 eukaryotic translation initiation factor 4 gamma [Reticulomyxa filosa]